MLKNTLRFYVSFPVKLAEIPAVAIAHNEFFDTIAQQL